MPDLCRLHYRSSGKPNFPAILFLHGFLGSGSDWQEIISVLPKDLHCVAPDLPGHGQTTKSSDPEAYSMSGTANAIEAMLDALKIGRCALVGYSMGGRLALYLALTRPQRWTRLVIESASPGIEDPLERDERRELDEKQAGKLQNEGVKAFLQSWYEQPLFKSLKRDKARFRELLERREMNDPVELVKSLRAMSAGVQPPLWDKLPQLGIPLLLIAGDQDAKYQQIAQRMASQCKDASLALVANAGHNVHVENPIEYAKLLRQFLADQSEVNHGKDRVARSR